MKRTASFIAVLVLIAAPLAGCSWFGEKEAAPLAGNRLPVLQAPSIDALAVQTNATGEAGLPTIILPDATANSVWGQSFAYPTHNPGHLTLAGDLSDTLWSAGIGKGITAKAPLLASPVIADNKVFAMDTVGAVSAFDLKTGDRVWKIATRGDDQAKDELSAGGGIAYGRGMVLITNGSRDVVAVNAATGAQQWRSVLSAPLRGAPTVLAGRAYVADTDNHITALDTTNGAKIWTYNGTAQDIALLGIPSPAATSRFVVGALSNGALTCIDITDGNTVWNARFNTTQSTDTSLTNLRDIAGAPAIDNNRVYAVNAAGRMIALDLTTGQRLWQKDVRGTGSIWPADDTVFLITREGVAARRAIDGELLWESPLPQFEDVQDKQDPITWYGPYLLSGKLYAFGSAGDAAVIDPVTGANAGMVRIDSNLAANPAVAGGVVAFIDASGRLRVRQ